MHAHGKLGSRPAGLGGVLCCLFIHIFVWSGWRISCVGGSRSTEQEKKKKKKQSSNEISQKKSTATSSMETSLGSSGRISTREDRLHRGRKVTLAFLMQGWGQFFNQVLLIVCMFIFNRVGDPPYSKTAAQLTFRISLGAPALGLLWLAYYRSYKMPRPQHQHRFNKRRVTGYDVQSLKLTFHHFGGRILATAGTWFCNDVFFYGNKLFQGQFIRVISDKPDSVMTMWVWNLINISVSMAGYHLASLLIDHKLYGRKTMQQVGFLMCFLMFAIPAFRYECYTRPENIRAFQTMYFLSSFFNQFGPNAVTFLAAGEVYPTSIRATAHGFSACMGKAGALLASVLYAYIDTQTKFYVVPWFGLAGVFLTWLYMPDTTGLDLDEQERRWQLILDGKEEKYHGVAVNPEHLSLWERMRGVGKYYDPNLDWQNKIEEMRERCEKQQGEKDENFTEDGEHVTHKIRAYFKQTRVKNGVLVRPPKEVELQSSGQCFNEEKDLPS